MTKLNAAGTALVYSTFIGGGNFDWGRAIAIDAAGNAYITGQTKSSNFPTTGGAFDRTFNVDTCPRCGIDQYDAFVTKLNAAGSALVYSTFLGGFDLDDGLGIAVDAAGSAYVTGETGSLNFPTTGRLVRHDAECQLRRVRVEAQCGRLRARLFHVPRRRRGGIRVADRRLGCGRGHDCRLDQLGGLPGHAPRPSTAAPTGRSTRS